MWQEVLPCTFCLAGQLRTELADSRNSRALIRRTLTPLAGPLVFFLLVQFCYVPLEEKAMAKKFGQRYADYREAVPRWW